MYVSQFGQSGRHGAQRYSEHDPAIMVWRSQCAANRAWREACNAQGMRASSFLSFCLLACNGPAIEPLADASADASDAATASDSKTSEASSDAFVPDDAPSDASDGSVPAMRVLWLDAAKGITLDGQSRVSKWADQTSYANDATEGTAQLRPSVLASAINGLPAVHFAISQTGNQLQIADSVSFHWGTGDFWIGVVARWDNNPDAGLQSVLGTMFLKPSTNANVGLFLGAGTGAGAGVSVADDPNAAIVKIAPYNDLKARLIALRRDGNKLELRVNGVVEVWRGDTMPNLDLATDPAVIGAAGSNGGAFELDGDIAEIIAVKGTMTPSDLATLESGLVAKYAL